MTFKNKLSEKYDSVQMEENRDKIEDLLERVVESSAKGLISKATIQVPRKLIIAEDIGLESFQSFLKQEEISFEYKEVTKSYYINLTE